MANKPDVGSNKQIFQAWLRSPEIPANNVSKNKTKSTQKNNNKSMLNNHSAKKMLTICNKTKQKHNTILFPIYSHAQSFLQHKEAYSSLVLLEYESTVTWYLIHKDKCTRVNSDAPGNCHVQKTFLTNEHTRTQKPALQPNQQKIQHPMLLYPNVIEVIISALYNHKTYTHLVIKQALHHCSDLSYTKLSFSMIKDLFYFLFMQFGILHHGTEAQTPSITTLFLF